MNSNFNNPQTFAGEYMRANKFYSLQYISGVPYLLPFGQLIADMTRGIQLNETGVFIWHSLEYGIDNEKELIDACLKHYEVDQSEVVSVSQDIREFIDNLVRLQVIINAPSVLNSEIFSRISDFAPTSGAINGQLMSFSFDANNTRETHFINIAGLVLKMITPQGTFADNFKPFEVDAPARSDMLIDIYTGVNPIFSPIGSNPVIINSDLEIYEAADGFFFKFPGSAKVNLATMDKDGCHVCLYCSTPDDTDLTTQDGPDVYEQMRQYKEFVRNSKPGAKASSGQKLPDFQPKADNGTDVMEPPVPSLKDDVFHAVRLFFLYLTHSQSMLMVHSASMLYRNKVWLFSAPSGTGKSTHVNIWNRLFNTPIVNGDLNLLAIENGLPVVKGTPWCGTSGITDTNTYILGGIILLKRDTEDSVEELPNDQKRLLVFQRLISPAWNADQIAFSITMIDRLAEDILICRLHCTADDNAAVTMKERIDDYVNDGI